MALSPTWTLVPLRWRGVMVNGSPAKGQIRALPDVDRFLTGDVSVFAALLTGTLDEDGATTLYVPATDDPTFSTDGFTYTIVEDLRGDQGSEFTIEVPLSAAADGIDLNSYVPTTPSPGVPVALVTRAEFDDVKAKADAAITSTAGLATTADVAAVKATADAAATVLALASEASARDNGDQTVAGVLSTYAVQETAERKADTAANASAVALRRLDPFRFDSTRLRAFKAALGRRSSTPVDVLGVGASWIAGSGAGTPPVGRWFDLTQAALRSKFQPSGVAGGLGYRESYSNTAGWVSPFAYTGAVLPQTTIGLGRKVTKLPYTATVTFQSPGTSVDVLYAKSPVAGNFTWKVNSGTATTVNANAATISDATVRIATAPGDTITLTSSQAGGSLYFEGAMFYNGDEAKGVRFWSGATSGYRTSDFIDAAGTSYGAWGIVDPDLVIIGDLVANDFGGGTAGTPVPVATMKANLATILAAIRARATRPPSVVLIVPPEITSTTTLAPWADYRQAMLDFAQADGQITVWDVSTIFGTMLGTDTYGLTAGDHAHPGPAGQQALADSFMDLLAAA